MRVLHESFLLYVLNHIRSVTWTSRSWNAVKLPLGIAACFGCCLLLQSVALAATDQDSVILPVQQQQTKAADQDTQYVKLPRWIQKILGKKIKATGPEEVSNPTPYAETQPTTPFYLAIPGFLQAPYGPPSFGPPFGTTHLLGDWGGVQPWLQKRGLYFAFDVYEDLAGNVAGGKKRDYSVAGQVGSTLDVDWEKLLNAGSWSKDLWLHLLVVNGHGRNLSRLFGDNSNQVQQIYGSRGNVIAHMVWADRKSVV